MDISCMTVGQYLYVKYSMHIGYVTEHLAVYYVTEHLAVYYVGIPRHTRSIDTFMSSQESFMEFLLKIVLWECCKYAQLQIHSVGDNMDRF